MNSKNEENGALGGPLIFTVPAYGFIMALYLDWLGRSYPGTRSAEGFKQEVDPIEGVGRTRKARGVPKTILRERLAAAKVNDSRRLNKHA